MAEIPSEPIHILIVDDEPKNLVALESVLACHEYRITSANSADEALLALIRGEFALIILDIHMPEISGFELAAMIKTRNRTANVPIIFLTAYYSALEHELEGYESGAVDYLHKPINPTVLRSKVAVFADLYRKNREIVQTNQQLQSEIRERESAEQQLLALNRELEDRVRRRTEELETVNAALLASEQWLALAQQASMVGFWECDLLSGQAIWTDAACRLLNPGNLPGPHTWQLWLNCIAPQDRSRAERIAHDVSENGEYRGEFQISSQLDGPRWIESVGLVEFERGKPVRIRGAIHDITIRKRMELQTAEAAQRKDQFLAMLGHELRNPLAPIRNAVSILRQNHRTHSTQDLEWCCELLDRQLNSLTRIVDDLLDISRVSGGKIKLSKTEFDLRIAVAHALENCRQLALAQEHKLTVSLPEQPILVDGDKTRLTQVFSNILNNAIKYTDRYGEIFVQLDRSAEGAQAARFLVRDSGRGFTKEDAGKLFDLFYQVNDNLDRSDGGLGIGLALVRSLVELHDGAVTAQSAGPGKGSTFTVLLPVGASSAAIPTPRHPTQSTETQLKMTVFVVDDNVDSANSMAVLLKQHGLTVHVFYDGVTAVSMAEALQPALILMDIGLPLLNGYEACRAIRELGLNQIVMAAITGYGQEGDFIKSKEAGFDHHLIKPIAIEELLSIIQSIPLGQ